MSSSDSQGLVYSEKGLPVLLPDNILIDNIPTNNILTDKKQKTSTCDLSIPVFYWLSFYLFFWHDTSHTVQRKAADFQILGIVGDIIGWSLSYFIRSQVF